MMDDVVTVQAYGLVFSVQVVFAAYQLMVHVGMTGAGFDPVAFAFLRAVGTAGVLLLWVLWKNEEADQRRPPLAQCGPFIVLGICMTCNVVGLVFALTYTPSATVAILQVMRPVFAGLISFALGIERFPMMRLVGMSVCMLGAFLTMLPAFKAGAYMGATSPWVGFSFVCVHSIGQSSYVILQPSLLERGYSPAVVNYYAYVVAIFLIGALLPLQSLHHGIWWSTSHFFIGITLFAVVFVGAYSYAAMGWAAKRIGGTAVMLFMLVQAILTVIGGHFLLDETITREHIAGGLVLIMGMHIFMNSKADLLVKGRAVEV